MRRRILYLMALATSLLVTTGGCRAAAVAPESEAEPTLPPTTNASATTTQAVTEAAGDQPPTSRPERPPVAGTSQGMAEALQVSPGLQEVIQLLRAGVDEAIVLQHIEQSTQPFEVGTEEIIFLTDLGASGQVISAMMDRDQQQPSLEPSTSDPSIPREPWPAPGTVQVVPATEPVALPAEDAVVVEAPSEVMTVNYFFQYLTPYGTWVDVPEYGRCWQPTVALTCSGWTPYGDRGRWVYTDCGWYWYSDYSWGWAVFHYGRWFHHSRWGWCWAPGTVWGPSWVTWRYYDGYCGWAPLPPYASRGIYFSVGLSWGIPAWCYTYVPAHRVCSRYPRHHAVPYHTAKRIHERSRTRDHYAVGRDHRIENRGIPPDSLTENPARDIRRVELRDRQEMPSTRMRRERLDDSNNTLTVFRPPVRGTKSPSTQTSIAQPILREDNLKRDGITTDVMTTTPQQRKEGSSTAMRSVTHEDTRTRAQAPSTFQTHTATPVREAAPDSSQGIPRPRARSAATDSASPSRVHSFQVPASTQPVATRSQPATTRIATPTVNRETEPFGTRPPVGITPVRRPDPARGVPSLNRSTPRTESVARPSRPSPATSPILNSRTRLGQDPSASRSPRIRATTPSPARVRTAPTPSPPTVRSAPTPRASTSTPRATAPSAPRPAPARPTPAGRPNGSRP
jgi:hypothetical protein